MKKFYSTLLSVLLFFVMGWHSPVAYSDSDRMHIRLDSDRGSGAITLQSGETITLKATVQGVSDHGRLVMIGGVDSHLDCAYTDAASATGAYDEWECTALAKTTSSSNSIKVIQNGDFSIVSNVITVVTVPGPGPAQGSTTTHTSTTGTAYSPEKYVVELSCTADHDGIQVSWQRKNNRYGKSDLTHSVIMVRMDGSSWRNNAEVMAKPLPMDYSSMDDVYSVIDFHDVNINQRPAGSYFVRFPTTPGKRYYCAYAGGSESYVYESSHITSTVAPTSTIASVGTLHLTSNRGTGFVSLDIGETLTLTGNVSSGRTDWVPTLKGVKGDQLDCRAHVSSATSIVTWSCTALRHGSSNSEIFFYANGDASNVSNSIVVQVDDSTPVDTSYTNVPDSLLTQEYCRIVKRRFVEEGNWTPRFGSTEVATKCKDTYYDENWNEVHPFILAIKEQYPENFSDDASTPQASTSNLYKNVPDYRLTQAYCRTVKKRFADEGNWTPRFGSTEVATKCKRKYYDEYWNELSEPKQPKYTVALRCTADQDGIRVSWNRRENPYGYHDLSTSVIMVRKDGSTWSGGTSEVAEKRYPIDYDMDDVYQVIDFHNINVNKESAGSHFVSFTTTPKQKYYCAFSGASEDHTSRSASISYTTAPAVEEHDDLGKLITRRLMSSDTKNLTREYCRIVKQRFINEGDWTTRYGGDADTAYRCQDLYYDENWNETESNNPFLIFTKAAPAATLKDPVVPNPAAYQNPFADTDTDTLEGKAAIELERRAIISGYEDGEFKGDRPVTRAEAAKFLLQAKYDSVDEVSDEVIFPDVTPDKWYAKFVNAAAQENIISGYPDGYFRPGNTVRTGEFLKMLTQTFGLTTHWEYPYTDVKSSAWYAPYAGTAEKYDLFPDRESKLYPKKNLTRKEVAVAIYQYLSNRE